MEQRSKSILAERVPCVMALVASLRRSARCRDRGTLPARWRVGRESLNAATRGVIVVAALATSLVIPRTERVEAAPPDATGRIAYLMDDGVGGPSELWIADSDGANAQRVLGRVYRGANPEWSPQGGDLAVETPFGDGQGHNSEYGLQILDPDTGSGTFVTEPPKAFTRELPCGPGFPPDCVIAETDHDETVDRLIDWAPDGAGFLVRRGYKPAFQDQFASGRTYGWFRITGANGVLTDAGRPVAFPGTDNWAPGEGCTDEAIESSAPETVDVRFIPDPSRDRFAIRTSRACIPAGTDPTGTSQDYYDGVERTVSFPVSGGGGQLSDFSPDGKLLVGGPGGLWETTVAGTPTTPVTGLPANSPNPMFIGWLPDPGCYADVLIQSQASWSSDKTFLVFAGEAVFSVATFWPEPYRSQACPEDADLFGPRNPRSTGVYKVDPAERLPRLLIPLGTAPDVECTAGSCLTMLRTITEVTNFPENGTVPVFSYSGAVDGSTQPRDSFGLGGEVQARVSPGVNTVTATAATGYTLTSINCNAPASTSIAGGTATVTVEPDTTATCTFLYDGGGITIDDRDGDGILNDVDACPDAAGPASTGGCPDRDGDNVPDNTDACPDTPGSVFYDGCPAPRVDSDHDGFSDTIEGLYGSLAFDPTSVPIDPFGQIVDPLATLSQQEFDDQLDCDHAVAGRTACSFQPGDIILWKSVDLKGGFESFFGGTYFTHSLLVVGRFVNTKNAKVTLNVADVTPLRTTEFKIQDISTTDATDSNADFFALGVYRPSRSRSAREDAAQKLVDLAVANGLTLGSSGNAPGVSYGGPSGLPDPGAWGPTGFYCSSLVGWAYGIGFADYLASRSPLMGAITGIRNAYFTPDDVIEVIDSTLVTGYGTDASIIGIFSPAHVLLTNPQGRSTGLGPDGTLYDELPGGQWRDEMVNESVSATGFADDWTVTLSGFDHGSYVLQASTIQGGAVTRHEIVGYTRPGLVETLRFGDIESLVGRPAAVDDTYIVDEQTSTALDVSANDLDPDNNINPTALTITSPPTDGTAEVVNGTIIYNSPNVAETTTDEFTYRTCDDDGHCSDAIVTITIKPVNTAPNINVGDDPVVIEANAGGGWTGALETVAGTTATDPDDDPVTLSHDAPGLLPLGDTAVTWTADDGTDTTTATQTVRVVDTTAPTLDQPPNIATHTADPHGTAVSYSPPGATDVADPAPTVTCSPGSGSMFAPGATEVTCTARDASGGETSVQFTVTVTVDPPPDDGCTIMGTDGNDLLIGTAGPDVICGYGGNDLIFGLGGDDTIYAGDGRDVVFAGDGDDTVEGGAGNDILFGGRGNDTLIGGPGSDLLIGGPGRNRLTQ